MRQQRSRVGDARLMPEKVEIGNHTNGNLCKLFILCTTISDCVHNQEWSCNHLNSNHVYREPQEYTKKIRDKIMILH